MKVTNDAQIREIQPKVQNIKLFDETKYKLFAESIMCQLNEDENIPIEKLIENLTKVSATSANMVASKKSIDL